MPKYLVWQKREFMFYQEVEADSVSKALDVAFEQGEWEQDQNYAEIDYTVELFPDEYQPEVDDLIKSIEESSV
jgi:hypothetical protein